MVVGLLAILCLIAAGVLLLRLHALPTGLSPLRDAVSDYGTTPHHRLSREMVVGLGVGAVLLAVGLARHTDAKDLFWLWIYGGARIVIAGFMTDRDPPPFTTEGRIHWLLAAVAFTAIALATTSIRWAGSPGVLAPLGTAVAASAVATLLTRVIRPLRQVFGLAERLLYLTSIAWLLIAAGYLVAH
jgi:hypothetical protein